MVSVDKTRMRNRSTCSAGISDGLNGLESIKDSADSKHNKTLYPVRAVKFTQSVSQLLLERLKSCC